MVTLHAKDKQLVRDKRFQIRVEITTTNGTPVGTFFASEVAYTTVLWVLRNEKSKFEKYLKMLSTYAKTASTPKPKSPYRHIQLSLDKNYREEMEI